MDSFGLNASTQETVNAILAAQKRSKELGIPLKDPSAPSPIVTNAKPEAKTSKAAESPVYTPEILAAAAARPSVASIKDIQPSGRAVPRTAPPMRLPNE